MAEVSTRYAAALLDSASKDEKTKFAEYLNDLTALYKNSELKTVMDNPRITNDEKMKVLKTIVPDNKIFINFLELILKSGRVNLLADISHKYTAMINKLNKKMKIKIVAASELTAKEQQEIAETYKAKYGVKEIVYETEIDPNLIGGSKVIADDKVYDGTVRTKLNEILK